MDTLGGAVEAAAAGSEPDIDADLLVELDSAAMAPRPARVPVPAGLTQPASAAGQASGEPKLRRASDAPRSRPVQVTIRPGAVMRGARAALVLRRAEALGAVSGVRPPPAQLERDEFDGKLFFRLQTRQPDEEIAAALSTVGDVEAVLRSGSRRADGAAARGRQIRVDLRRLDALMKQVGELVVAKNRLTALSTEAGDPTLIELSERIARLVSAMQAEVLAARMTPVGEVFERFPRLARDLSRDLGKQIRFDMEGEEIELDRSMLDEIGDPLAASDPECRRPRHRAHRSSASRRASRPRDASSCRPRASGIPWRLRVIDDGRGIDRARILEKARSEGVATADVDSLTDDLLVRVLARPGFSTAQAVSGVSGRGVGVDVAMTRVRALGGTLEVRSELGRGSTFLIRVPLTLAIVRALLAEAGGERYAVPLAYVAETVEFDRRAVTSVRDREALVVRDQVIPTVHLRDLVSARHRQ